MRRIIFAAAAFLASAASAFAQSGCPSIATGAVLTAAQWQACFQAKQNTIPYVTVNKAGDTLLGRLTTAPASTLASGFNLPHGTAPTSPNNGDTWTTTAGLFVRINGATVGPLAGPSGGSFAATSPITVSFPASVVTYAFDFSVANTFTAAQTIRTNASALPSTLTGAVLHLGGTDATTARLQLDAFGDIAAFTGAVYGGTAASPTAVTSGTQLTGINAYAYNGTALAGPIASFRTYAAQTIAAGAQGSKACIATTANSTTTLLDRLCIGNDGVAVLNVNPLGSSTAGGGTALQIIGINSQPTILGIDTFNTAAIFVGRRADGTVQVPIAIAAADSSMVAFTARGYDGVAYSGDQVGIGIFSGGAWTPSSHPAYFDLFTTASGSTTILSRFRVEANGGLTGPSTVTGGSKGPGTINLSGLFYSAGNALAASASSPIILNATTGVLTCPTCATSATPSGAALTKADDTNVTLTLGGSPTTALLNAASVTVGWTGTLAAARLNSNVVQSVVNDTNVTGSISAQALTLGWTGTAAVARGGTGGGVASGTLLDNITGFASTGMMARTASGTYAFRTIAGTSNRITLTNGDGVAGTPTIDISSSYVGQATITTLGTVGTGTWQATVVGVTFGGTGANLSATGGTSQVLKQVSAGAAVTVGQLAASDLSNGTSGSGLVLLATAPTIVGGAHTGLTSLGIRSTGSGAFDLFFANTENLTAGRTLTLKVNDAARTIDLSGNLTLAGAASLPAIAQGDIWYGSATGVISALAKSASATRALCNTGTSNNPAWCQIDMTTGITGTTPVGNGGTGTATAFTQGSVVFAGASGVYSQSNSTLFWDSTQKFLGLGTTVTASTWASTWAGIEMPGTAIATGGTTGNMQLLANLRFDGTNYKYIGNNPGLLVLFAANANAFSWYGFNSGTAGNNATPNLRMNLGGAGGLNIGSAAATLGSAELGMDKITDPASAPGAGSAKLTWVAGTNAGTCKLISRAGTSTTAVTIVDNVGGSC